MPTLSTVDRDATLRLRSIPWHALAFLSAHLEAPLARVLRGSAADRELDRLLRKHGQLSADQRSAIAESVFGVSLWRRRLAHHIGVTDPLEAPPKLLLFSLLRDLGGVSDTHAAQLIGLTDAEIPARRVPPADLAAYFSLPDWLADVVEQTFADEARAFASAISVPGPICIRANTLRGDRTSLAAELRDEGVSSEATGYSVDGLLLEGRPNILGLKAHQRGLFEVQDEGSQLLAELLGTRPGETVLDFCAGSGGKTLALGAALQNRGKLFAFDVDAKSLDRLLQRTARAGVDTLHVLRGDVPGDLRVDRVLVDAPCSALGVLRRGPDVRFRIDPAELLSFPPLQREILRQAATHVRPGGRLVYATCTFVDAENQHIAHEFEAAHSDFVRIEPSAPGLDASFTRDGFFACAPHLHGTDGFFAAVYERRG